MSKKPIGLMNPFVILGLIFIALVGIRTISTPEIWSHLAQGRAGAPISYVDADQFVNTTLLYDKLVFGLWSVGGATALILFNLFCLLGTFLLLLKVSEKWGGPLSQGLALLVSGHLIFQGFDVGPRTLMMLFVALFVFLVSTIKKPAILFSSLIVLQILWTNMHDSFVFGPFIVFLAAIQLAQNNKGVRKKKSLVSGSQLFVLSVVLLLTTLINPYFLKMHVQVFHNLTHAYPFYWVSLFREYFQVQSNDPLVFLVLILGAAGLITQKKRLPVLLTTLAMLGAFLLVRSAYASQLFVALAFPFMVLSFSAVGEQLESSFKSLLGTKKKIMQPLSLGVFALLILFSIFPVVGNCAYTRLGSASTFGLGAQENLYPSGAKILLENPLFPERAINFPEDGGYLAFKYNRKIFIDYRSGRYKQELIEQLNDALSGDRSIYDALFDAYRPEAFILNTLNPASAKGLVTLLAQQRPDRQSSWKMVYFDGITAVLLLNKKDAAFAPLLDDPTLQKAGLDHLEKIREEYAQKSLKKGCRAGNVPELIGAGKIFLALNRPEESEAIFSLLLQGYKGMPGAWIGLGNSQLMLKNFDGAVESLKTATKLAPKNLLAWSSYAQACKYAGHPDEERKAIQQALQILKKKKEKMAKKEKKMEEITPVVPEDLPKDSSIQDLVVPE